MQVLRAWCMICHLRGCAILQGPTASMGIYIDSGSIYETPQSTGVSVRS